MELTEEHLKAIKDAARQVSFGSVSIEICETQNHVDIVTKSRLRMGKQPTYGEVCQKTEGKGFRN